MDTSIKIKKKSREDHSPLTNRSVSIDFSDVSKSKKGKKSTASLSIETPEPIVTSDRRYSWLSGGPKIVNVNSSNLSSLIKVKSIKRPRETTVFGRQMAEGMIESIGSSDDDKSESSSPGQIMNNSRWKTLSTITQAGLFLNKKSPKMA